MKSLKKIFIKNLKFFLVFVFADSIFSFLCAKGLFADLLFDHVAWGLFILALLINLIILKPMYDLFTLQSKSLKVGLFIIVCIIVANIWLWTSITLGTIIYFSSGGISG
ncbi:MAG: hypothetical protein KAI43_09210 [Candidatus Aureabacteria bacterium]|nr:hypothetical protein [Candidatus Auribacterota bacterium]